MVDIDDKDIPELHAAGETLCDTSEASPVSGENVPGKSLPEKGTASRRESVINRPQQEEVAAKSSANGAEIVTNPGAVMTDQPRQGETVTKKSVKYGLEQLQLTNNQLQSDDQIVGSQNSNEGRSRRRTKRPAHFKDFVMT